MTFYVIICLFSVFFYYLATIFDSKHNRYGTILFFILFLLLPSLIGGLRDLTIGTDMNVYGIGSFYNTLNYPLRENIADNGTPEYGYVLLNYICAHISSSINFFLFVAELIKISCIGYVAWNLRKEINSTLLVALYLLSSWWYGFSLMRQSLGIAVSFVAILLAYRKKYLWAIFSFFIAYEFHNSAMFAVLLSCIFLIKGNKTRLFLTVFGSFAILSLWQVAIIYMAGSGLFRMDMDRYIDSGVTSDKINIVLAAVSILLSVSVSRIKKDTNTKNWNSILLCMSVLYLCFLLMSKYIEVAFRVSFYARVFVFIAICYLAKNLSKSKYNHIILFVFLSMLIVGNYIQANHGAAGTLPYTSEILGI